MEKVQIKTEYITLGQFLKFAGIISFGSDAKAFLQEEKVLVNEELENRRGRKLYPGYKVEVKNTGYIIDK